MNNANSIIDQLRSYKVMEYAVFDFVASFVGMYFIAQKMNWNIKKAMLLTIPFGIMVHLVLDIDTPLNRQVLGPENYLVKLIIGAMVIGALVEE